jgi:hypothetical protein
MNIVIYVNYSEKEFNKDFSIANVLLKEHNVFFAINGRQLSDFYPKCDLLIRGISAKNTDLNGYKFYDLQEDTYLNDIQKFVS